MKSTPSKLYATLIVIIGLIVGYVGYSQWIVQNESTVPAPAIDPKDNLTVIKNLKIDYKILDDSIYKGLITSGESPVGPGTTGKKDIFAP